MYVTETVCWRFGEVRLCLVRLSSKTNKFSSPHALHILRYSLGMNATCFRCSLRNLQFVNARKGFALHGRNIPATGRARNISTDAYASLRNSPSILNGCFKLSTAFTDHASSKGYSIDDFLVYPEFVTKEEHDTVTSICEKKLRRSFGPTVEYFPIHPDSVIHQYRECSASHWGKQDEFMKEFINKRIYSMFPDHLEWLDPHILGKV
jgi:hypothetical protein